MPARDASAGPIRKTMTYLAAVFVGIVTALILDFGVLELAMLRCWVSSPERRAHQLPIAAALFAASRGVPRGFGSFFARHPPRAPLSPPPAAVVATDEFSSRRTPWNRDA